MSKRKFIIVTDSGCDMPQTYLQEQEIVCLSLAFTLDGVTYNGEDMEAEEFYQKLKSGSMPVTHQITPEQAKERIEPFLKAGKDVLGLAFSSGLSGTAGSYKSAARELKERYPDRKILIVDTLAASMGQGLLVDYAVRYADEGHTIEDTRLYIERLKGKIAHIFTVDNLYHLKRGGRISGVTALIGTILKIKPVMHVDEGGKLVVIEKCMGRKKALQRMIERLDETQDLSAEDKIFISHGAAKEEAEKIKGILQAKFPHIPVVVGEIGPVIGTHSGAGTLAIFYKAKTR